MSAHCGRLDAHDEHPMRERLLDKGWVVGGGICPGVVVIEGGAECVICQWPVATCEHSWRGQMRRWAQ